MAKNRSHFHTPGIAFFAWGLLMLMTSGSPAQTPPKKPEPQSTQPQGMGGVSTGAPIVDNSRRTVGIVDPKAPVIFEIMTDKTALATFKHKSGGEAKDYIIETVSGGAAIFDYDDPTLHFGLGAATAIDKVEILWPDGSAETVAVLGVDRKLTVVQGKGASK